MKSYTARLKKNVLYIPLLLAVVFTVGPILWMVSTSFGDKDGVFSWPINWIPNPLQWENYTQVIQTVPFFRYLFNSIIAGLASALISIVLGVPAAYGFAKFNFKGKKLLFYFLLSTMMIPPTVIAIPLYLQLSMFDLVDTYWGLILPAAMWPLGVFILRQAIKEIPDAYLDAARVDGAGEFYIFTRIVFPQVLNSVIIVGLYSFLQSWNNYLWPLIVVSSDSLRTLPLGLDVFQASIFGDYHLLMTISVLATLPTVIMFIFLQRYFMEASLAAGLKD